MLTPLSTTAPMPISDSSPMVQPCSMTWWPTVTFSPTTSGMPTSACSTLRSWMLLPLPMRMDSVSPRITVPNQTLLSSASATRPITCALSATQAVLPGSAHTGVEQLRHMPGLGVLVLGAMAWRLAKQLGAPPSDKT